MNKKRVKFQGFEFGEGWQWKYGDEGEVIEETDSLYKVKIGWFRTEWVRKDKCEEIKSV